MSFLAVNVTVEGNFSLVVLMFLIDKKNTILMAEQFEGVVLLISTRHAQLKRQIQRLLLQCLSINYSVYSFWFKCN